MGKNQPELLAFLMALTEDLDLEVKELAIYIAFVVYRIFVGSRNKVKKVTSKEIIDCYEYNKNLMGRLEGAHEKLQALRGQDLTVYVEGSQTRSFCYVDDLVDGLVKMMENDSLVGPVNLGNPGEFTVLELANIVKKLTGSSSKIVYNPLPPDDPVQRKPDITLARESLGWRPHVGLEDGLLRSIEYFSSRISASTAGL